MIATRRRRKYGGRRWPRSSTQRLDAQSRCGSIPQAVGDDPTKQPHSESPISIDINALGVDVKKLQKAICDGVKLLRSKVMGMHAVVLPKDDQRNVAYLSRRKDVSPDNFS